jgi:hypothetical protein
LFGCERCKQVLDGVSLLLHIGEFALQQVAFLNDRTYCAKKRVAGRKARAAEYTRELGTYLGAHYELSAAHLLPLDGERPSALGRNTATLHDVAQAHALVEQLEGERRGFAVGRSGGCASGSSSMDLQWIEEMNTIDDVRMKHASLLESTHGRR